MAIASPPAAAPPQSTPTPAQQPVRLLTVDEAIRMSETGILADTERVEMVEGVLVQMTPEGPLHIGRVASINELLVLSYAPGHRVSVQSTLRLHDRGYRIPDFVVSNAPLEQRPPRPDEIALVIEVAYSSLAIDLDPKARDYARYGVPAYWVLDLRGRRLVTHAEPADCRYGQVRTLGEADRVTLPRTEVVVAVSRLLDIAGPPAG